MDVYGTEEEKVEAIKKWWNQNGKSIIAGIVIGITAIYGWRGYINYNVSQEKAASIIYEKLLLASRKNDTDNIRTLANSIITNYESSTYSVFSKLMLAKIETESGNLENAEIHLNSILDNNLRDEFKHIARLRLIRVLIANDKLESAEKILSKIKSNKFFSHYEELRGDILVKKDRIKEAAQAYKNALTATEKTEEAQLILQMKLDDLGKI